MDCFVALVDTTYDPVGSVCSCLVKFHVLAAAAEEAVHFTDP